MNKPKKTFKYIKLLILVFLILICLEVLRSKYSLETTHYQINIERSRGNAGLRIVQLTDLHDSTFGNHNEKLVSKVAEENPDLIFITGDLINSHIDTDLQQAVELISDLVEIAPVYLSLGNQEYDCMERGLDVVGNYESAGATVLDFSYVDISLKGNNYRIGGIYGYCQPMAYAIETHRENEAEFLKDFQNTDACKLLLCHMPVCWISSYSLYDWDVDLVFAGHVHGGQIRIPYIGGLWAPDQGWFPGEVSGVYITSEEGWVYSRKSLIEYSNYMGYDTSYYKQHMDYYPSTLILSRGLGNTEWVPRFNNTPEIVVVDTTY